MKARSSIGVPPRLSPKGIIPSQRLSFRPGFLGRGLNGRYPPSPVPVQGSTSHPGRNAGRHDAQAAREVVTDVNRKGTPSAASPARGRLAAQSAAGAEVGACSAHPHPTAGGGHPPAAGEGAD
jgi:hypothetical protein